MIFVIHQLTRLQLELKLYLSYPKFMLKRFTYFFACVLLVLMPLQGIAAANMSICNSMMQSHEQQNIQQLQAKPCHMHMAGMTNIKQSSCKHDTACKTACATLCASLSVMTEMPSDIKPAHFMLSTALLSTPYQAYASITQPNLQRPPILLA